MPCDVRPERRMRPQIALVPSQHLECDGLTFDISPKALLSKSQLWPSGR
jgi:hypothetical protein